MNICEQCCSHFGSSCCARTTLIFALGVGDMPNPKWGMPFPKGTGLGPIFTAFAKQAAAKPKAIVAKAAPKVQAKHAAPSAADGVPKAVPAQLDSSGIITKMRLPDFVVDDGIEVRVSAAHAHAAPGTVYRECRMGNTEGISLL